MHSTPDLVNEISQLLTESDEVLKLAENEFKHMESFSISKKALGSEDNIVSSDWLGFRKKYETW